MGRNAIGIEIMQEYYQMIKEQITLLESEPQLKFG